jgi:flagellar biosynthesis/type III secretory pathway protein FliH
LSQEDNKKRKRRRRKRERNGKKEGKKEGRREGREEKEEREEGKIDWLALAFNSSTWEAEAGGLLSSRPAWSTE